LARTIVVPYLLSRVIVLSALFTTRHLFTTLGIDQPLATRDGLLSWDAAWYRVIARDGYDFGGAREGLRFFPLFPMLAKAISWVPGVGARPWGVAGALESSSPDYEKYALNATKTIYFGPFSKVVVNGAWFTGRRLDRFSRYQFGLFDETRIHGVPSAGVRYGELAMARGQYSCNLFEQYRLDLFPDRARGRTREIGVPWEGITRVGVAVTVRSPGRNLILRADVGKSFLPDRYRRLGSTVVQVLFLRPLN
jgi:hypothetical protein